MCADPSVHCACKTGAKRNTSVPVKVGEEVEPDPAGSEKLFRPLVLAMCEGLQRQAPQACSGTPQCLDTVLLFLGTSRRQGQNAGFLHQPNCVTWI